VAAPLPARRSQRLRILAAPEVDSPAELRHMLAEVAEVENRSPAARVLHAPAEVGARLPHLQGRLAPTMAVECQTDSVMTGQVLQWNHWTWYLPFSACGACRTCHQRVALVLACGAAG
jgi:hypothetical protein